MWALTIGIFLWVLCVIIIAWKLSEKTKNPDVLIAIVITGAYLGVFIFLIAISVIEKISLLPGLTAGE